MMTVRELKQQLVHWPEDAAVFVRVFRHTAPLDGAYVSTPRQLNVSPPTGDYDAALMVLDSDKEFQR